MRKIVHTDKAAQPIGPYNQAVIANDLVFTSGQIAIDPTTGKLSDGDVSEQTKIVMGNLTAILEEAGTSLENVVKTTIYLNDMNDFPTVNAIYGEYFDDDNAPARATVEVARLPKDVLVEIDAIATL